MVRVRWVAGLVLFAAGLYLAGNGLMQWQHDRWLMSLPPTQAMIVRTDDETIAHRPVKPGQAMELSFTHQGKPQSFRIFQSGFKGEPMIGEPIQIYVNPNDPADLTIRNEPIGFGTVLAGGIVMSLLALVVLLTAWLGRSGLLKTWSTGNIGLANVLGREQSALAPRSRVLQCAWADGDDPRIFRVFVPRGSPEESAETVEVVFRKGARPQAIAWFR